MTPPKSKQTSPLFYNISFYGPLEKFLWKRDTKNHNTNNLLMKPGSFDDTKPTLIHMWQLRKFPGA